MKNIAVILAILLILGFVYIGLTTEEPVKQDNTLEQTQLELDSMQQELEDISSGLDNMQIEDLEQDLDLGLN